MTLLRDIQDQASSGDTRVADLLRRCKILAARLQSEELSAWVNHELNGYDNDDELPDYRLFPHVEVKGNFAGPFGSGLKNVPIPIQCLGPAIWKDYMGLRLNQGVASYEHLVFGNDKDIFCATIPADRVLMFADQVYQGQSCLQAWQEIPRGVIVSVLDAVKTKVLGFALDIEKENPAAGEADASEKSGPVPATAVQQAFHTNIYGNVGNVATGSQNFQQNATLSQWSLNVDLPQLTRELPILRQALMGEATDPEHYVAIGAVREAEIEVEVEKKSTPKLLQSLAKAGPWASDVATKIGTAVAAEAIKRSMQAHGFGV